MAVSKPHHLIYGTLRDYLSNEELTDTDDERIRQDLSRLMVEEKGYDREQLQPRIKIETLFAGEGAHSRQALELAVAHQLVSPLTHFLLVETRAEANKAADMPDRDLAYFAEGSEHFADYVEAVRWAQECAMANRQGWHRRLCWARSGSQLPGAARSCLLAALVCSPVGAADCLLQK